MSPVSDPATSRLQLVLGRAQWAALALLAALLLALLTSSLWWRMEHDTPLLHYMAFLYDRFDRLVRLLATALAIGLTWLLLVPFFYLCFVPGRLVLMALRKDPMNRECPSAEKSYWVPYRPSGGIERYSKQY